MALHIQSNKIIVCADYFELWLVYFVFFSFFSSNHNIISYSNRKRINGKCFSFVCSFRWMQFIGIDWGLILFVPYFFLMNLKKTSIAWVFLWYISMLWTLNWKFTQRFFLFLHFCTETPSSFLHRFQFVDDTPWRIHCSKLLYTFFVVVVIFLIDRLWCNVMFKLNIYVEILFCGIYLVAFFCFCFCCCCCNGYLVKLLIDTVLWGGGWQTRNKIVMWRHI